MEEDSHSQCEFEPSMNGYNRNEYQEIIWLKSGTGKAHIFIDDREQLIPFNSFVIVGKGRVHHMKMEGFLEGAIIRFTDDLLPDLPHFLFNAHTDKIWIDAGEETDFFSALASLFRIERDRPPNQRQNLIYQNLLQALLGKLEQLKRSQMHSAASPDDSNLELFQQFYQLLEQFHTSEHHIDYYSNTLNISPRKLSEINNRVMGRSTGKIIEEKLLLEAKRSLLYSNSSIKEIAFQLGFEDNSYFSKFFKRHTKLSPSQFRTKHHSAQSSS